MAETPSDDTARVDTSRDTPSPDHNSRWHDARRLESWAGETRVNFIRAVSIAAFYGHHLLRMYVLPGERPTLEFHQAVSLVAAAWMAFVLTMHGALARRAWPGWMKYAGSLGDVALVTILLVVAGGPASSLVVLYLMVVGSSALRLSLKLVWTVTAAAEAGYLCVVGFVIRARPALRIAHADQVVFMLALLGTGLIAGQIVRQARRLTQGGPVEVEEA